MNPSTTNEPLPYGFGYTPTPLDEYNLYPPFNVGDSILPYPTSVDLSSKMTTVKQQGWYSSCVGFAVCAALEVIPVQTSQEQQNESDAFVWFNAKMRDGLGNPAQNRGTLIPAAIASVQAVGSVFEPTWPYSKAMETPGADVFAKALNMRVIAAYPLPGHALDDYKKMLCQGWPIVVGFDIFGIARYLTLAMQNGGFMAMPPTPLPSRSGGHAVLFVGYDDDKKLIKFKYSWGPNTGDNGYYYMPYDYLQWTRDAWVILRQDTQGPVPIDAGGDAAPSGLQPCDVYESPAFHHFKN
ncbi:MAG: hypothetical protein J3R72DRAFT_424142 [Linnemannia gamsii]|nr:MAG: hypothetical protein J3R72DRAFT_424142 [Linnemannia gamsii]